MSKSYRQKEAAAKNEAASRVNSPEQRNYMDIMKFPPLPTNASGQKLMNLYKLRHQRYLEIRSTTIQGIAMGIEGVPVTAPYNATHTYHIVVLCDHRRHGGPIIELLVREVDNYVVGWRIIHTEADRATAPWYEFDGVNLPRKIFGAVIKTGYNIGYGIIQNVKIGTGILPKIYDFLLDFPNHNHLTVTEDGKIYLDTLFVMFGEGQRYAIVQQFLIRNVNRSIVSPSDQMVAIIRDWSALSVCIFQLYLAILEKNMGLAETDRDIKRFGNTMQIALTRLETLEKLHGGLLKFRGPNGCFRLENLAGGEIFLLKHEHLLIKKIIMRLDGYKGAFIKGNPLG